MKKTLVMLLALLLCTVLGYWTGVQWPPSLNKDLGPVNAGLPESRNSRDIVNGLGTGREKPFDTLDTELSGSIREYRAYSSEKLIDKLKELEAKGLGEQAFEIPMLFSVWAERDPKEALQAAKDLKHSKDSIVSMVLQKWVDQDPGSAAAYYKLNEKVLFTRNYGSPWEQVSPSQVIARALAASSTPAEAIIWANELIDVADKTKALGEVFRYTADQSPDAALELLDTVSPTQREIVLPEIASVWQRVDSNKAIDWINTLPEKDQDIVLPALVMGMAETNPELASTYMEYITGNRDDVIGGIVSEWSKRDPQKAGEWLVREITIEEQSYFVAPLLQEWVTNDPVAAKQWVLSQNKEQSKDEAVMAYVEVTASGVEDPLDLIDFATREIGNPVKRERAVTSALVALARKDAELSEKHLRNLRLSKEAVADYYHQVNAEIPLD